MDCGAAVDVVALSTAGVGRTSRSPVPGARTRVLSLPQPMKEAVRRSAETRIVSLIG
jgi:hypothetical protein